MKESQSRGLWEASAPAAPLTSSLHQSIEVDVVIVGAGFTGLSAALHLAQGGASVAVLEAQDVGFGGSGRNVGLVNAGMWTMPVTLLKALGEDYGKRLLQLLSDAPSLVFELVKQHNMPCEALRRGTLHCAVGAAGLAEIQQRAQQWQHYGAPVRLLNAQETAQKIGSQAYQGALLDERAGTIQPLAYVRGLAHAALAAGAQIYTHSAVRDWRDEGERWCLQTQHGNTVSARWVMMAGNAYSTEVGGEIRRELVRLPYFNMATAPLSAAQRQQILPEGQGAWDTRQVLTSFRLDQAGRLVFGSVGALRGSARHTHRQWGRRAMRKLFPQLAGLDFEYEWYGWIGMTNNALPRLHRLGRNVLSFSGYNGRGIAPGTTFGREFARLILGEIDEAELPLPITPLVPVAFREVQECWYERGAQLAHVVGARG